MVKKFIMCYEIKAKCLDVVTDEVKEVNLTFTANGSSRDYLQVARDYLKKSGDNHLVPVYIISGAAEKVLFEMAEDDFIKHATKVAGQN